MHHALIRACENQFNVNAQNFMAIHLGQNGTLMTIGKPGQEHKTLSSKVAGAFLAQKIKETLSIPLKDATALLQGVKKPTPIWNLNYSKPSRNLTRI
ncbi:hypothetical protein IPJ72_05240 [Candidatus Peregrinibacteria bacterium]|nr:MAG: hypothetical protein IPJ72_05240 [Candidatus Peregrinibacteria bacterium]